MTEKAMSGQKGVPSLEKNHSYLLDILHEVVSDTISCLDHSVIRKIVITVEMLKFGNFCPIFTTVY